MQKETIMKRMMLLPVAAAVMLLGSAYMAQAQVSDATSLTAQAIKELTDYPAVGKRHTAYKTPEDFLKYSGTDVSQMKKSTAILQDALGKARSGNASRSAVDQLEMAVRSCNASLHKECRLSSQGALWYLCQGGGNDEKNKEACEKAPKFGSYVAP
jgi:hypothetical protein